MSKTIVAVYSGSGIGFLIGVLMGLAVSPTVGVIIGSISSILAVLLGLNDKHFSDVKAVRIGSFGFSCVLGAFLGMYVRTHNLFSPSLDELKKDYMKLGYKESQALDFIAFTKFGILDEKWKMAGGVTKAGDEDQEGNKVASNNNLAQLQHASVLFAAEVNLNACENLRAVDESLASKEIVINFEIEGGFWKTLAKELGKELNTEQQSQVLLTTKKVLCANKTEKVDDKNCKNLASISGTAGIAELIPAFSTTGGIWKQLADETSQLNMNENAHAISLRSLKTSLCQQEKGKEKIK